MPSGVFNVLALGKTKVNGKRINDLGDYIVTVCPNDSHLINLR